MCVAAKICENIHTQYNICDILYWEPERPRGVKISHADGSWRAHIITSKSAARNSRRRHDQME